jgi:hypothetical protein
MKKNLSIMVCALALFTFTVSSAKAAGPINFYIRGGIITPSDFSFDPIFALAGANIDINIGAASISPECDLLLYNFTFNPAILLPGVLLNFNLANFYIGAGAVLPLFIGSGYSFHGDVLFKANAGLKLGGFKLQAFALTSFSETLIGATFGAGF